MIARRPSARRDSSRPVPASDVVRLVRRPDVYLHLLAEDARRWTALATFNDCYAAPFERFGLAVSL